MDLVKVTAIQALLGIKLTGKYDPVTKSAIRDFQRKQGLVPDGIIGKHTNTKLRLAILDKVNSSQRYFIAKATNVHIGINPDNVYDNIKPMFADTPVVKAKLKEGLSIILKNKEVLKLDTLAKLAHFLGQVREEVGYNFNDKENLNYSIAGLKKTFRVYRDNQLLAVAHGRSRGHPARQKDIANTVYGGRYGNDNIEDGSKYIGGGSIQVTFKSNNERLDSFTNKYMPSYTNLPSFVKEPEAKWSIPYSLLSGAIFWSDHNLGTIVSGSYVSKEDSNDVTKVINKYTHSYDKRWAHTKKFAKLLGVRIV